MLKAAKYSVQIDNWLSNVVHIWKRVLALSTYFYMINTQIVQHRAYKYTVLSMASDIVRQWELEKQRDNVKVFKPCTTRSAFTTQEATLRGKTNKPAAKSNKLSKKLNKKSKKKGNRKRKQPSNNNSAQTGSANVTAFTSISRGPPNPKNQNSTFPQKRNKIDKCNACSGMGYKFSRCYLVRKTTDKKWVDREVFDNNMKVLTFRKRVKEVRSAAKVFKKANKEWRCKNRGRKRRKVVGRVSSLSQFNISEKKNDKYSLLDSGISVHVFYTKRKFSNFRTSSRDKRLLCGTSFVPIEGWGDISLLLCVGN